MKQLFTIFIAVIFSFGVHAQGENNNWVFGSHIRLDFNSGSPVQSNNVANIGSSASSSISDAQGNLQFYTDVGIQNMSTNQLRGHVYNTQNQIMQNGDSLYGQHSLQCTNILPFPCNDSLYYIFNLSQVLVPNYYSLNLYYSVVNMNANNGLGAVIQKNILLDSNLSYGFALTRHGNNIDYWISYKKVNSNIHIQRQITSTSIGAPINSPIGTSGWGPTLKFSPDGTKLVSTFDGVNLFEVYDFNNLTGTFSNPMYFTVPTSVSPTVTSLACSQFSPDMSKLYITGVSFLLQYDFSSNNPVTINNSGMVVSSTYAQGGTAAYGHNDIALAPNNVIYTTRGSYYLGGITQPNNLGLLCQYDDTILTTLGNTGAGFPTALPSIFVHRDVLSDSLLCQYDTINLYLSDTTFIDSVAWNFGDTTSGAANTSTDVVPLHVFNTYGVYPIEVIVYSGCVNDTIHDTIRINPTPIAQLGNDTILCEGDSLDILFTDTSFNYLWSQGDTTLGIEIWQADTYWVELSSVCGIDRDSIVIDSIIPAYVHFPNDTLMCIGDSLFLDANVQNGTYLWSTGDTVNSLWVHNPGSTIWVQTVNICNADSDTIVVNFTHPPNINLGNDSILCNGTSLTLNGWDTLSTFLWSTSDTVSSIIADTTGSYSVTTTNLCGVDSDSIQLWFIDPPTVNLGNDTILCLNKTMVLQDTSSSFPSYLWNNGSWHDSNLVTTQGVYSLTVTNVCGVAFDTIEVWYDDSPITNLGPDSTYCLNSLVNLNAFWSRAEYLWNTADTTANITANYSGQYSVMVTNLCGYDGDTVLIAYDIPINFSLGWDTTLCIGDSILLSAPAHNATWLWHNGNTDSTLIANQSGTYWVSASNTCGTFSDTLKIESEDIPELSHPVSDTAICIGEEFTVLVPKNNANSIVWNDGTRDYQRTFVDQNTYNYTLYNICGQTTDSFTLAVEEPLEFGLGNDTIICYGEQIVKELDYPNHTYLWNNGSEENTRTITRTGIYGVTIWTPAQCESYDELEVTDCNAQLFIPNAFTPGNGDQHNNTFKVQGEGIRKYHIVIYDRWGMLVFESFDLGNSWQGLVYGKPVPSGIYSYKIWYNTGESSQSVTRVGSVTLIR